MNENKNLNEDFQQKTDKELPKSDNLTQGAVMQDSVLQNNNTQNTIFPDNAFGGPIYQNGIPQPSPWAGNLPPHPGTPYISFIPEKHEHLKTFQSNFPFFSIACLVYALFYTFCLYQNLTGITVPFLAVGTLLFGYFCLKKANVPLKKDVWFYAGAIVLLGINLCMTKDNFLIFFDYAAMLLLLISGFLHLCCDDKKWDFSTYISAIFMACLMPVKNILNPFFDGNTFWKKRRDEKGGKGFYIFIGVLCGLPLLILVLALLGSADSIFGDFLDTLFFLDMNNGPEPGLFFMPIACFFFAYAFLTFLFSHEGDLETKQTKQYETLIAVTINAMLAVFYLIFSMIQIIYLFLGKFTLPAQYTYAEYAKQGFYQLLAVCFINLILVLVCVTFFEESKALKIMLAIITGCTYIMIMSSALRMKMYVEAYELTYLRLNVFWMLAVLFVFFTGILVYIFRAEKFSLFRLAMVIITVFYIGYAYARPETIIANYNLREEELANWEEIDLYYLTKLSSDAYPIFREACEYVDEKEFTDSFTTIMSDRYRVNELADEYREMNFRTFNFSLYNGLRTEVNKE